MPEVPGTFNLTFDRKDVHEECARLVKLMGLRGCVGVDLMIDPRDNKAKVIEINPRILACSKIGFVAGVNQAQQIIQDVYGDVVTPMINYKTNVGVRMSQIDVLWFLKSPDRFKAKPSWSKLEGLKIKCLVLMIHYLGLQFLFRGVIKLKSEEEKRR